jgi:hypothetical protein
MAQLVLKRFQCVEDTNESGGESPYFITWVGNLNDPGASTLTLTAQAYWNNNVDKGPGSWPVNDVVCAALPTPPSKALALAVMVEKDEGRDIVTAEMQSMKQNLQNALQTWVNSGVFDSNGNANFVNTMKNTFEAQVRTRLQSSVGADDDLMEEDNWRAARRITLTSQPQELAIVTFKGGDGQYNVRYAVTN